jgi:hypothetical protein
MDNCFQPRWQMQLVGALPRSPVLVRFVNQSRLLVIINTRGVAHVIDTNGRLLCKWQVDDGAECFSQPSVSIATDNDDQWSMVVGSRSNHLLCYRIKRKCNK